MRYLEDDELDAEELRAGAASRDHRADQLVPVSAAALKNKGVQPMLDAVVDYLPSPLDVPPVTGIDPRTGRGELTRRVEPSEPFAALVFKIVADPYVGKLAYVRVYSGKLDVGQLCPELDARAARARRPAAADARQPPRRDHRGLAPAISRRSSA